MLNDQAREAFLALLLVEIATQHHKLLLEIEVLREMRRELAAKDSAQDPKTTVDPLRHLN